MDKPENCRAVTKVNRITGKVEVHYVKKDFVPNKYKSAPPRPRMAEETIGHQDPYR